MGKAWVTKALLFLACSSVSMAARADAVPLIGSVDADGWTLMSITTLGTHYYKPNVDVDGKKTIWIKVNYNKLQNLSAFHYWSAVALEQFDCAERKYRYLMLSAYSQRNLKGDTVLNNNSTQEWLFAIPETEANVEINTACRAVTP